MPEDRTIQELGLDEYKFGFHDPEEYFFKSPRKGIDPEIVAMISKHKKEPEWMLEYRLKALESFLSKPTPQWGGDLSELDFEEIYYYIRPMENQGRSWDDVPDDIKNTFERLGIPQAERESLAGVSTSPRSSTTRSRRSGRRAASCLWIWTRACASTKTSCASTSGPSSRPTTTSFRH
jgi:Fe-S cluster assembly protein SufB